MKPIFAGILTLLLGGCNSSPSPTSAPAFPPLTFDSNFPNVPDDGGAPTKVLLRLHGTPGKTFLNWHQTRYFDATDHRLAILDFQTSYKIVSIQNGVVSSQSTELNLVAERDDFHSADRMKARILGHMVAYSLNASGNVVSSSEPKSGLSYNFPIWPVSKGSTWTGSVWRQQVQKPVSFHLDKIVQHKKLTYAQITITFPGTQMTERYWFDVTKGSFARHEILAERVLKNGHILITRSFTLVKAPQPSVGTPQPGATPPTPHLAW